MLAWNKFAYTGVCRNSECMHREDFYLFIYFLLVGKPKLKVQTWNKDSLVKETLCLNRTFLVK